MLVERGKILHRTCPLSRRILRIEQNKPGEPLRQALLEMYVDVALGTPSNDFDNHQEKGVAAPRRGEKSNSFKGDGTIG